MMKKLYTKYMDMFLMWLATKVFRSKTRIIYTDGKKYLLRTYLKKSGIFPGVYIHRFYASDEDRFLHDHPCLKSMSLILTGSYLEERLNKDKINIDKKILKQFSLNVIDITDFHRITILQEPIWTIFFTYKRKKTWGFWDIENQKFITWTQYVAENNNYVTDLNNNKIEFIE